MTTLTDKLHRLIDSLPITEAQRVELRRAITEYGATQMLAGLRRRDKRKDNEHEVR